MGKLTVETFENLSKDHLCGLFICVVCFLLEYLVAIILEFKKMLWDVNAAFIKI